MALSDEGALLNADFINEEERGIQGDASGEASISLNHSAEQRGLNEIGRSFWRQRERTYTEALIVETDPSRRTELETVLSRVKDHLRKGTQ